MPVLLEADPPPRAANWFLEQMLDLAEEPLDDRTIQYLFEAPENDGGQIDMAISVLTTFGLVPQSGESPARRAHWTSC